MDTQNVNTELHLDDEALEAVTGGMYHFQEAGVNQCLIAFLGAAGPYGHVFTDQFPICA
jgi:hypothetical protein